MKKFKKMTEPKKVSDFAKEYEQTYIGLCQCESAHKILCERTAQKDARIAELEKALEFEKSRSGLKLKTA